LGSTYTNIGTVPASTTWNVGLNIANRTAAAVNLRAYVADTTWTTGEPSGSTLKAAICYDLSIAANGMAQITGIVMATTEKLIVYAGTATSLDIIAFGVSIA
jgi:hypothetical protein